MSGVVEVARLYGDDPDFAAWHAAFVEGMLHDSPHADDQGARAYLVWLTRERPESEPQVLVARLGGTVVGGVTVSWPRMDNAHLGELELSVVPSARRAGVGTALLDAVVDEASRRGRTTLVAESSAPLAGPAAASPGGAFLSRRGFAVAMTEVHYTLQLPLAEAHLARLAAAADGPSSAYRLVSWTDRCPDEWAEAVCRLYEAFNDEAPTGDLTVDRETWTVDRLRLGEERRKEQGRTSFSTVAVAPDSGLVGETELMVSEEMLRGGAFQSGTLVQPGHRGHRLGLAMKVANLRQLLAHDASERLLHTWNEQDNQAMIGVNTQLGFAPVEAGIAWQRQLA